jgi:hypothetical protein
MSAGLHFAVSHLVFTAKCDTGKTAVRLIGFHTHDYARVYLLGKPPLRTWVMN